MTYTSLYIPPHFSQFNMEHEQSVDEVTKNGVSFTPTADFAGTVSRVIVTEVGQPPQIKPDMSHRGGSRGKGGKIKYRRK